MSTPFAPFGTTNLAPPSKTADGQESAQRHGPRGEVMTMPVGGSKLHGVYDYFTAVNPTPGTGLATIAAESTFSDLKTVLFLRNGSNATKNVYLDYIKLVPTAAGTNGTNWNLVAKGDKGGTRYASGGSSLTPANANMASSTTSGIDACYAGAVVTTAATANARLLWHSPARTVIKVIGDQLTLRFGDASPASTASTIMAGSAQASLQFTLPPVILGPGDTFLLHEWCSSQDTAAGYEVVMGWWEA